MFRNALTRTILCALVSAAVSAQQPAESAGGPTADLAPEPIRFEMEFDDGSQVTGIPSTSLIELHADGVIHEMPLDVISTIAFHDDHETATVTPWQGDPVTGVIDFGKMQVETALGTLPVPAVRAKTIRLSLGGISLKKKPWSYVEGNRHFEGAVRSKAPHRILGRNYAPTEFISAHASGRLEYRFDEPVTEFAATIALYDSYGGTKGNVVFKVATERAVVYQSPGIRHFRKKHVYVSFEPTKRLVLITDSNGAIDEDWAVWLHPEVR